MSEQSSGSGLRLRILGMPVRVPISGLIGVGVIAWLWAPSFDIGSGGLLTAIVFAVLLYVAILFHELAHGLTARRLGQHVQGITLWILGGFTVYERDRLTPGREAAIAASGPATTLVIAAGCAFATSALLGTAPPEVVLVLDALAVTNLLLGILNLLPGLPLDGGGIVRAAVWRVTGSEYRGTLVAAWVGRVLAVVVVAVPLVLAVLPNSPVGLQTALVGAVFGVFLWIGATASLRAAKLDARIPALAAAQLARRAVPSRPGDSLALASDRMAQAQAGAIVVVDDEGRPIGIVNDAAAAATPPERRAWVPVSALAITLAPGAGIDYRLTGHALIDALRELDGPVALVRDADGAVYGVLFIDDVEAALG